MNWKLAVAAFVVLGLAATLALIALAPHPPLDTRPAAAPAAPKPALEVLSWKTSRTSDDWLTTAGEVKNLTGQPLRAVEVVATFYTKTGELVTKEDALLEFNPVMPGQTSPFEVRARFNPQIDTAKIAFRYLAGEPIVYVDHSR